MAGVPAPLRPPNPADKEITTDTRNLGVWSRYINGIILASVWTLFAGEHHIPANSITAADWHRFLWIVCSAILALLLDRIQAINNLLAHRRKHRDIERGLVDRIIFGEHEFQFRFSWWLFYVKVALTLLNAAGCLLIFGRIVLRWTP